MSGGIIGRPRAQRIDDALVKSVEEILAESGFRGLTVNGVLDRAGSNRPSFYRRYGGVPELLLATVRHRYSDVPEVADTGDLETELLEFQREQARIFDDPVLRNALPGLLEALRNDQQLEEAFLECFVQPRETAVKNIIGRAVLRGEIAVPEETDWIYDLLTGPLVMRAGMPGRSAVDERLVQQTVRATLTELRQGA